MDGSMAREDARRVRSSARSTATPSRGARPEDSDGRRLALRNRLSHELARAASADEVVRVVGALLPSVLGVEAGIVLQPCPSRRHLHGRHALGAYREIAERVELVLGADDPWERAWRGSQVHTGELEIAPGPELAGTFAAAYVPMGDDWVLALLFGAGTAPDAALFDLARAVADETWAALERAHLVTQLEGKVEILEATAAIASVAGLDLEETLAGVARRAARALSCERAGIYLRDDDGGLELAHLYASDQPVGDPGGWELVDQVLTSGQVLVQNTSACAFLDGPWHHDRGAVAVLGRPLRVGGRDIGALVVAHTRANPRGFTSLCQEVAGAVAQQAALAIEHAQLHAEQQAAVADLEERHRRRADFVAGVTHDLRTPLTGIRGFLETLDRLNGSLSAEDRARYIGIVSRQARTLESMVGELLLAAQAEHDHLHPAEQEPVDVAALLRAIVEEYAPDAARRLAVDVETAPAETVGDRSQLRRVVQNLVDNALKYAPGDTTVEISLDARDAAWRVTVCDRGPGVPPEDRERIFERFGVAAEGRQAGSTGLGLFISRAIARGHGGDLRCTDRRSGPGSCFELTLPRQ